MKTGESAWVVRVARLQATKVCHTPFFVPELAHRWTNRRRRRRREDRGRSANRFELIGGLRLAQDRESQDAVLFPRDATPGRVIDVLEFGVSS